MTAKDAIKRFPLRLRLPGDQATTYMLAFTAGNRALYRGQRHDAERGELTTWDVYPTGMEIEGDAIPAVDKPAIMDAGPPYSIAAMLLLNRVEIGAVEGKASELAELLRSAAADPDWKIEIALGNITGPGITGTGVPGLLQMELAPQLRERLGVAARAIEAGGTYQRPDKETAEELLLVGSARPIHDLRTVLARNDLWRDEGLWSYAPLAGGGWAELRAIEPEEEVSLDPAAANAMFAEMRKQREEIGPLDVDVLDAVTVLWLQRAKHAEDRARIYIDDICRLRGLKKVKAGSGRRGGYKPGQRADAWAALVRLSNIWLHITKFTTYESTGPRKQTRATTRELSSPPFLLASRLGQRRLDGKLSVDAVLVTPGQGFGPLLLGPGRQVAMLSANALRYNTKKQAPEKALLRYLAWQWRVEATKAGFSKSYRIETLVEVANIMNKERPARTKDRLEKALETLATKGDIASWQYEHGYRDEDLQRKGWLGAWLRSHIIIEAPENIKQAYQSIIEAHPEAAVQKRRRLEGVSLGTRVANERNRRGLTQARAAEEMEVAQGSLSRIEAGKVGLGPKVRPKVEAWLARDA